MFEGRTAVYCNVTIASWFVFSSLSPTEKKWPLSPPENLKMNWCQMKTKRKKTVPFIIQVSQVAYVWILLLPSCLPLRNTAWISPPHSSFFVFINLISYIHFLITSSLVIAWSPFPLLHSFTICCVFHLICLNGSGRFLSFFLLLFFFSSCHCFSNKPL